MPYSEEERETRREINRWGRFSMKWVFGILVAMLLVSGAIWALNVALSGPKGQGDAIAQNNSAENWIDAQAGFEEDYAEIIATDVKINNAYDALQADPDDQTLYDTYTGLMSYCLSVAADYNAAARSFLTEDWRDADLPDEIKIDGNSVDPATDCKENTQ